MIIFLKCLWLLADMENTPKKKKEKKKMNIYIYIYIEIEEIYNKNQVSSNNLFCIP